MNELSLFTGGGGGVLGTMLLGFRHVGYVEWDDYCQRIIRQRIDDGILHDAPIFGDIRAFISDGYAASYTGMVDVVTAGFPCQPFSVAGKRRGVEDERNMWPATRDVIRIVKPGFVLLENVPGIRRYLPVVIRDLRRLGYAVRRPLVLGADDVGAPHRRKRVWILADSERDGRGPRRPEREGQQGGITPFCPSASLPDSERYRLQGGQPTDGAPPDVRRRFAVQGCKNDVADTDKSLCGWRANEQGRQPQGGIIAGWSGEDVAHPESISSGAGLCQTRPERNGHQPCDGGCHGADANSPRQLQPQGMFGDERGWPGDGSWWATEPDVGRVAHVLADRLDFT